MNKGRSLQQYRAVDLTIWSLILLLFESIVIVASVRWFPAQPYTVSLVPAIIAIVLVRWGPWAAIQALLGGALACLLQRASVSQFVMYCGGNLLPLALLPALAPQREKGKFPEGFPKTAAYGLAVLLLNQTGRALLSLAFGGGWQTALACYTTEAATDLITLVILWITSRLDGVLEDQPHYVRRIAEEEKH